MEYGEIGYNEFSDDDHELSTQMVFVEDYEDANRDLEDLIDRYDEY